MAKFCETCGKQLEDEAVLCPYCGAQTGNAAQMGNTAQSEQPMKPLEEKSGGLGLSIASMVCGIVSLVFSCCVPWLTMFIALVGVILGGIALANKMDGKGMAIAGLVCSIVALVPAVIVLIIGTSAIGFGSLEELMNSL